MDINLNLGSELEYNGDGKYNGHQRQVYFGGPRTSLEGRIEIVNEFIILFPF